MRYFFRVEYDGTNYGGWQSQTNSPTIQDALNRAFSTVIRENCVVIGAGRTDAGVHAKAQGAHVDINIPINIKKCEYSVNAVLPYDICIYNMQPIKQDFHARYSAVKRIYNYYISFRKNPLLYKRVWMIFYKNINWELVHTNIKMLLGEHDFSSFCASNSSETNKICNVYDASLFFNGENMVFSITANRFLYKMVRTIIGTLIDIGRGKINYTIKDILKSKNRKLAGETAPPCGLVLDYVEYPDIKDEKSFNNQYKEILKK